jgi:hypothetical protein
VTVEDKAWSPQQNRLVTIRQPANTYYPSPEMHEDAAAALVEPCGRLAAGTGS